MKPGGRDHDRLHCEELIGRNFHEALHYSKPDGTSYPAFECPHYNAVRAGIPSLCRTNCCGEKTVPAFVPPTGPCP